MAEHFNVVEQFGIDVFNEETMKQRLPKNVFKALKKTIAEGKELDSSIAYVLRKPLLHRFLIENDEAEASDTLVPADDRYHR